MVNTSDIITLIEQGRNFSQVAKDLGCARNTVKSRFWKHVKDRNYVQIPSDFFGVVTRQDKLRIVYRKLNGDNVSDIAQDFSISDSYVYKIIREYREQNGGW